MQKTKLLKQNYQQLKELLKYLLPACRLELVVFVVSLVIYLAYSLIIVYNTSLIDHNTIWSDIYFSFDNQQFYTKGYAYVEAHPLIRLFMFPILKFGNLLLLFFTYKAKTLWYAVAFGTLVAMSNVYVFRYLKRVVGLKLLVALLLTAFYGFSATNLILSFTAESFTFTAFILPLMLVFYSEYIKKEERITLSTNLFFAISLGGITFTNFVKGLVPMLFQGNERKSLVKKLLLVIGVFCVILACTPGFLDSSLSLFSKFSAYGDASSTITESDKSFNVFRNITDLFLGASILFSSFYVKVELQYDKMVDMITLGYYQNYWAFVFLAILYLSVIVAIVRGYRNRLIQMLFLIFFVDIFIHLICLYGLQDPFIYGGHWVCMIPLFLGWLYKSLNSQRLQRVFVSVLSLMLIFLILNNTTAMVEFTQLAMKLYPAY